MWTDKNAKFEENWWLKSKQIKIRKLYSGDTVSVQWKQIHF